MVSSHTSTGDDTLDNHDEAVQQPITASTTWTRFVSLIWDDDYYTKPHAERVLVFKLDCLILSVVCLGWLMKYIDQTNLANAYVSGMKQDLNLYGNQYTYMGVCYNAAFAVMQVPSNLIVLKIRPSYWLAASELGWMAFTFAQAGARNATDMYVFRTFVGFFEAAFQPVTLFLLGSWYTAPELAKRISIWYIAGLAGQAFSGYLQAAIYSTLDGRLGLAGWRWLYIICGAMTLPTSLMLLFLLPDFPNNCRSPFITPAEREMAKARCARNGTVAINGKIDLALLRRVLGHWRWWVCVLTYTIYGNACQDPNYFAIWLSDNGVSVVKRNIWSSGTWLIAIPFTMSYGYIADRMRKRYLVCFIALCWACVPTGILAVYPDNFNLMVFGFFFSFSFIITPVLFAWFNEIALGDAQERAVILASANGGFYITNTWLPAVIFRQTDGPRFHRGFPTVFACAVASPILFTVMKIMHDRQQRQEAKHFTVDVENSQGGYENEKFVEPARVVSVSVP